MATRISSLIPLFVITLGCIGIVEGGYMALEYLVLQSKTPVPVLQKEAVESPIINQVDAGKKYGYELIISRNLFAAASGDGDDRLSVVADLDTLQATSLGIVLMGTIGDDRDGNRAIIVDKKTLEQKIYRQGEEVQGAIVKDIRRGKVIISSGGRDEILDMSEAVKLRPVQKASDTLQAEAVQQDLVVAGQKKSDMDELHEEELRQQSMQRTLKESQQSTERILRPSVIRPIRPPATN